MTVRAPATTDPLTVTYEYTFHFTPTRTSTAQSNSSLDIEVVTTNTDREDVKEVAFERAATQFGYSDVDQAKNDYTVDRTTIGFHDQPWDTQAELEQALLNIDGVQRGRYVDPYVGVYGPPAYFLKINKGSLTDVVDDIESYYAGLTVNPENPTLVEVIISPSANIT